MEPQNTQGLSKFLITWMTNNKKWTPSGGDVYHHRYKIIGPCSIEEANDEVSRMTFEDGIKGEPCGADVPMQAVSASDEWGVWTVFDEAFQEIMKIDLLIGALTGQPAIVNPTWREAEYYDG